MLRRLTKLAPVAVTCGALLSFSLALLGYALLGFLFLTRYYAPASHHYVRPLHFDYTGYVAVASAPLSPNLREQALLHDSSALPGAAAALLPKSRFLPSGTQVAVHVILTIPADHTDLFQVTGELLTNTTHVAARSTRTYINTPQPYMYRVVKQFVFMPLHVLGWGHGDWVNVDLPLFDSYEEREDTPVAMFRARLASRNASRGGLPPPPVQHAELHVRLRLGYLQTVLFWMRPGLAASVVILLLGLLASVVGTSGAFSLLVLAFLLRRWIAKAAATEDTKANARRKALPAPKRKVPPYGSFDEALSYSLATAEYYSDAGPATMASVVAEEDDTAGTPFARQHGHGRRGSTFSDAPTRAYESDTSLHGGNGVAQYPVVHAGSPAWSGSSGGSACTSIAAPQAAAAARSPSRQGSGASVGTAAKAAIGVVPDKRPDSGRPTPALSPQPPAATDDDEDQDEADGIAADATAAAAGSTLTEHDQKSGLKVNGGRTCPDQDAGSDGDEELETLARAGQKEYNEELGTVTGGKSVASGAADGHFSDLEPQADNEAAGAALRRRSAFTWKA